MKKKQWYGFTQPKGKPKLLGEVRLYIGANGDISWMISGHMVKLFHTNKGGISFFFDRAASDALQRELFPKKGTQ